MKSEFVEKLRCPARDCSSPNLVLQVHKANTIQYNSGPAEEVQEGTLSCETCGRSYPISEYVLSFDSLFSPELLEEADFWSKWYGFLWDRGYLGFFDLRAPMAPLITEGIEALDPATLDKQDLGGSHMILAEHPLVKQADWVLDIGCGTGWSSLFLARHGHRVVGFDPSTPNMKLAKRYAIEQGEYIEYMGAAIGYLSFKPEVFDAIFALHSIHHVPRLRQEMIIIRQWLRNGGVIAVDEHVRNNPILSAVAGKLQEWARSEVYPKARTVDRTMLEGLPTAGHSSLEDAGSDELIDALLDNFTVDSFRSRYVSLDSFSFLYFLASGQDTPAYHYSSKVIDRFYKLFAAAFPEDAEYITLIGRKDGDEPPERNELAQQAEKIGKGQGGANAIIRSLNEEIDKLNGIIAAKNNQIAELEGWARGLQKDVQNKERLLRKVQSGKVMRALNAVGSRLRR